jgi:hypothetical protein
MGNLYAGGGMTFHVERITDKELIRTLLSDDEIIHGFTAPREIDEYIDELSDDHYCFFLLNDNEVSGLAVLLRVDEHTKVKDSYVIDIGFYEEKRGKVARDLCRLGIQYFIKNYPCSLILGFIEVDNRAALVNAIWCGFKIKNKTNTRYCVEYRNGR